MSSPIVYSNPVRLVISAQDAKALARNLSKLAKIEGRKSACAVVEFDLMSLHTNTRSIHVCDARTVSSDEAGLLYGKNPFFSINKG